MEPKPDQHSSSTLSVLADSVRRELYELVVAHGGPVRRDYAAVQLDISRTLAAYHLDKLVEAGMLVTSFARPPGIGGPGAGRPAKLYAPAADEVLLSVPPRNYRLLSRVLAAALEGDQTGELKQALRVAAEQAGHSLGAAEHGIFESLEAGGYRPREIEQGVIETRNCPFHQLSREHTELVCGLNHVLIAGALEAGGEEPARAELSPQPGRCCVVVNPAVEPDCGN